jgi:hypothetical protein
MVKKLNPVAMALFAAGVATAYPAPVLSLIWTWRADRG